MTASPLTRPHRAGPEAHEDVAVPEPEVLLDVPVLLQEGQLKGLLLVSQVLQACMEWEDEAELTGHWSDPLTGLSATPTGN